MKKVFAFLILSLSLTVQAQRQSENWYFGQNAGLNFSSGEPQPLTDGVMNAFEGSSAVSDATGNLLFYTNGISVWNRNHEIMQNGDGLSGHFSGTQSSLAVPVPGSGTRYYIFSTGAAEEPGGLYYTEVDMAMNMGLGAVTSLKNIELLSGVSEQLAATFHGNGVDIWVVANGTDAFFNAFLITAAGITPVPVTSGNALLFENEFDYPGCAKFSPDGSKLAVMQFTTGAYLYDFNNTTGAISNRIMLSDTDAAWYGAEFSSSGRYLYTCHIEDTAIVQYDLQAQDIPASGLTILENPFVMGGAMQRGINGKIYITHANYNQLSVINNPNNPGAGSTVQEHAISVAFRRLTAGLPAPVLWPVDLTITAQDVCDGTPVEFSFASETEFETLLWDFGDGNTSADSNPAHVYAQPGIYTVTLVAATPLVTRSVTRIVTVLPVPEITTTAAHELCLGSTVTLSAPEGFDSYTWSNGDTGNEITVAQAGNYTLTVTSNGCEAEQVFTVTLIECHTIPKGISPNNDGMNDAFDLSAMSVDKLTIFNRYGTEVFSRENYSAEWTGQTNDGRHLPDGTYYYSIQNAFSNYTGWVYINREH